MIEENIETSNIHLKWLENIFQELKMIQDMERMAREGCVNLMEFLQIPIDMHRIILGEAQYKNLKFMALELDILIRNLTPVLAEKTKDYIKRLNPIITSVENRELFLYERKINNQISAILPTDFLRKTVNYLIQIKSDILKDISPILYIKENTDKKTW